MASGNDSHTLVKIFSQNPSERCNSIYADPTLELHEKRRWSIWPEIERCKKTCKLNPKLRTNIMQTSIQTWYLTKWTAMILSWFWFLKMACTPGAPYLTQSSRRYIHTRSHTAATSNDQERAYIIKTKWDENSVLVMLIWRLIECSIQTCEYLHAMCPLPIIWVILHNLCNSPH